MIVVVRSFVCALAAMVALAGCSFDTSGGGIGDPGDGGDDVDSDASGPVTLSFRNGPTYSGTDDTMIDTGSRSEVFGDETVLDWFQKTNSRYLLLRFGSIIGSAGDQIPVGTQVISATLHVRTIGGSDTNSPGHMRRVQISWDESMSFDGFTSDGQIDDNEMDTSSSIDAPTTEDTHQLDVTADVSGWVTDPATNNGWIIEPTSTNGISIHSSEAGEADRPMLEVTFVP